MKGSLLDMIFLPVVLLVIGISIFVSALILEEVSDAQVFNESPANITMQSGKIAIQTFDTTILLIAFSIGIAAVIYGYFYPSHPIFLIFGVIILLVAMVTTPIISNTFAEVAEDSTFAGVYDYFPMTTWVMGDALPIMVALFGVFIMIVMYSRLRSGTT